MFEEHIEDFCVRIPDFRLLKTNLHTFFNCSRDVFYLRTHRYDPEGTFLFLVELAAAAALIEKEKR
jgi:translation initiation factor 2 beta subunit (eIF-2beta)/eIF-5